MTKHKDLSPEVRHLKDELGKKWISVISICAFMALGVWMLLDPSSPKHASIEKGTVYILKEIWSWPAGLIIVGVCLPLLIRPIKKIQMLSGKVWIKADKGYYLFDKKERISGLNGMQNGQDLIVFLPNENTALNLKGYYISTPIMGYQKATPSSVINCQDAYWNADSTGYLVFYQGKHLADTSFEKQGNDLLVSSSELNKQFKLVNYQNLRDNVIRIAEEITRNKIS